MGRGPPGGTAGGARRDPFETVFSAPDKVEFLHRARQAGYFVRVFFIGTSDPRINAS
jgi:predicted ABC-type ATPase